MWYRLRNDFQLAIVTLVGVCAAVGIAPFAVYRFLRGDTVHGVINSVLVLTIVSAMLYGWRTGRTRVAAWISVVVITIGCMAVATLFGLPGLLWMYAVVQVNFLLLRPREALAIVSGTLIVLALHGEAFESTVQMAMFLATASLVALISFGFAYRTEQQRQQLHELAIRDPLTGAANRRSMEEELQVAIEASRREPRPYGLAIMDIDHFKRVNDDHGHAAGDQVLIDLVGLVRSTTRKADRLFRFGGEEFVLLIPGVDTDALRTISENLRARLGETLATHGEPVTVSIGAAALLPGETWAAWMARADAALYQAKREGRNRSVMANGATLARP